MKTGYPIQGYSFLEKLGQSRHAEVFKVCRQGESDRPLVLKIINPNIGSGDLQPGLRQQIECLKQVDMPGVINPELHNTEGGTSFLVQEFFDGRNLNTWRRSRQDIPISDLLKVLSSITGILAGIHKAGHIHGGIKPNNILIAADTLEIRLIDLVRVIDVGEISHLIYDEDFRKNTLSYISPEQTGRIRQRVDYTTDLYSLGVVFYELIGGAPPFTSNDPLEVIHSHLAEDPIPLNKKSPEAPEMLSDIVARLMRKEPEKRYQTAQGLLHDIRICEERNLREGDILSFTLGLKDYTRRINVPTIMVGRDEDKKLLLSEHAATFSGSFRAAIISGLPGIGKTRLIQELQMPVIASRGYFTSGKYDRYQRNNPYSIPIQAIRNLMRIFLTENSERITHWKETMSKALGVSGRLITDLIPELELIIGPQPPVHLLPPADAKKRFNNTIERFISCLAGQDHPLTLFMDDLQWGDIATFELIENIFANSEHFPYFFLLAAYRHNEVDGDHSLTHLLHKIRGSGKPLLELPLSELGPHQCNEMLSYVLSTSSTKTERLSKIINLASEGNPLFINESVSWLHSGNLLHTMEDGSWQWDEERIRESQIPKTTVALFEEKIRLLPKDILDLLQIAACLGTTFKAQDIALIAGKGIANIYQKLSAALHDGILSKERDHLAFFHDRVQEAVYNTLDREKQRTIHAHIAEAYMKIIPEGKDLQSLDNLFEITEHINRGRAPSPDKQTLSRDAEFNYYASKKAMDALALEAANKYLRQGMALITEDHWKSDYESTFLLYKDLARSELGLGNQEESERLLSILLDKAKTDLDRAECLTERAGIQISLGDFRAAIAAANQALTYLDRKIPEDPKKLEKRLAEFAKKVEGHKKDIRKFDKRPVSRVRKIILELTLYNMLMPSYWFLGDRPSFVLCCYQGIYLLHQTTGIHDLFSYSITVYSFSLINRGDYKLGFEYADLNERLFQRFPDTVGVIGSMTGFVALVDHWRSDLLRVIQRGREIMEWGKSRGDNYRAGQGYTTLIWACLLQCRDLRELEHAVHDCLKYAQKYRLFFNIGLAESLLGVWVKPMQNLSEKAFMDDKILNWKEEKNNGLLCNYYVHGAMADYYLGNYRNADTGLREGEVFLAEGSIPDRGWHVFYVLNLLRLHDGESSEDIRESILGNIQPVLEKIELWSGFGPALRPYYALIRAELKRFNNEFKEARALYLDTIDMARENEYTLLEGHANDFLGEFLLQAGYSTGSAYITEAAVLYKKCGAKGKLSLLKNRYPQYFRGESAAPEGLPIIHRLDTAYLMKASRAISQELDINGLFKTIIRAIMEGTGARESCLIMEEEDSGSLLIRAHGAKDKTLEIFLKDESLPDKEGISLAIIRYVYRTNETVILGNAMEEGPFVGDREVLELKLRSVMCCPIMKQGEITGIIYLQNNLKKDIFTEEDIELVTLLASQAAISLENAGFVEDMKVAEKELRESEERYSGIFNATTDGIVILDDSETIVHVNPAYCKMLGRPREELLGRKAREAIHPDRRSDLDLFLRMIEETGRARVDSVNIHKDGTKVWVEVTGTKLPYQGQTNTLFAIIRDVGDRKRAQDAILRQREEEIRLITIAGEQKELFEWVNTFETFVAKFDPDGNMFFCNQVALRGTGVTKEEVYGKYFSDMVFWSHSEKERAKIVECFQKAKAGISSMIETSFRGGDGSTVPLIFNCQPLMNEKGDVQYITAEGKIIIEQVRLREELQKERQSLEVRVRKRTRELEDMNLELSKEIAERKHAEKELSKYRDHLEDLVKDRTGQLEAAQEELVLKERLATLGKLTATVSHEIRNPMGTIRTSLYSINERARGKGLGMEKALDRAERSIVRCDRIIEELLDYTRTRDLDPEPTIIDDWLMKTLDDQVAPEGVTLARKLNSGVEIPLDREHFRRCLVNIMDNAIKAIGEKREDMIAAGNEAGEDQLVVESLIAEERLEVRITDTGTGIPPDQLEKIFEPLFSSRGFGIGLGLPTVKQIMERHGGGIKIESAAGRGTTVTLWLLMNYSDRERLNE